METQLAVLLGGLLLVPLVFGWGVLMYFCARRRLARQEREGTMPGAYRRTNPPTPSTERSREPVHVHAVHGEKGRKPRWKRSHRVAAVLALMFAVVVGSSLLIDDPAAAQIFHLLYWTFALGGAVITLVGLLVMVEPALSSTHPRRDLVQLTSVTAAIAAATVACLVLNLFVINPVAQQTLFEVDAEGTVGLQVGALAPVRDLEVFVEHPGVVHHLQVNPRAGGGLDAEGSVELELFLVDPNGRTLVDEPVVLDTESCGQYTSRTCWSVWRGTFTPSQAGPHRLQLVVITVDVHTVHLRIADPLKTDGRRAPSHWGPDTTERVHST